MFVKLLLFVEEKLFSIAIYNFQNTSVSINVLVLQNSEI